MIKNFIPLVLFLAACGGTEHEKKQPEKMEGLILMGSKIQGDFNGDGEIESIEAILTKEAKGSPQTDADYEPNAYELKISDKSIALKGISHSDNPKFVNEGDLNGDGTDEISVISNSPNGTQVTMEVMSYDGKSWKVLVKPEIENGLGTDLTLEDYQKRVYLKNGKIHYKTSDSAGVLSEKQL